MEIVMEQQPPRRRRPLSVRFPVSPPDMNDAREVPPPTSENMDNTQSNADEQGTQPRTLHLRQSRFKGLGMAPRNITPTSGALNFLSSSEFPLPELTHSSPLEIAVDSKLRRASNDLGILQEVSNSSLRRKRGYKQHTDPVLYVDDNKHVLEEYTKSQTYPSDVESCNIPSGHVNSTIMANSSLPLRSDTLKTPHARVRSLRNTTPNRPAGTESEKHIEYLESQLAALQTRLQALTSPSTSKTQSAKLRAVTSESRTLRQEVADWERKFHDRISEQMEQNEKLVGNLKGQIKSLQRELESSRERMTELGLECVDKDRHIMAAESANYDLERRLEFMSEMLATSPVKMQPPHDPPLVDTRRISAPRPQSRGHFQVPQVRYRQIPTQHDAPMLCRQDVVSSPESPTRKSIAYAWEDNPFDRSMVEAATHVLATELDSTASDASLIKSAPISPSWRRSFGKPVQSDNETKTRPTRRMRRFYTGSMGPRSLILPGASQTPSLTSSPPLTGTQTPLLMSQSKASSDQPYHLGFKLPVSPERPHIHVRSATWDDNEASASRFRKATVTHAPLPLPSPSKGGAFSQSQLSAAPSFLDADTSTPLASRENSVQSFMSRDISLGSIQGRNLFEELNKLKRSSVTHKEVEEEVVTELPKLEGMPLSEYPLQTCGKINVELGISEATYNVDLSMSDLSEEPDNNCAILATQHPPNLRETKATPAMDDRSPKYPNLTRQPTSLIERLLSFVSRTLDASTPSVSQVISNAWSIVTLSRPVLEFRWWLVRLLVGGLRRKRRMKLLVARTPVHALGISNSPGLIRNVPDTLATNNASDDNINNDVSPTKNTVIMRDMRILQGFHDDDDENVIHSIDGSVGETDQHVHNPHQTKITSSPTSSVRPPSTPMLSTNTTTTTTRPKQMRKPIAWLKFSMTLVFAVGVAIRDGPASLFTSNAGGGRDDDDWAIARNIRNCADDIDDFGDG